MEETILYPSSTYRRSTLTVVGAVAAALAVDACGTNDTRGYAADVVDASTAPDGDLADGATCGQLDKPCCADESCDAPGTFCSLGTVCKNAHPSDVGMRCSS